MLLTNTLLKRYSLVVYFLAFFINIQAQYNNIQGRYECYYNGRYLMPISMTKAGNTIKIKITKESTNQNIKNQSPYILGTYTFNSTKKEYVKYISKGYIVLHYVNNQLITSYYDKRHNKYQKIYTTAVFKNKRALKSVTKVQNTPSIKGKYSLKNRKDEVVAVFNITQSSKNIYVEKSSNSNPDVDSDEYKNKTQMLLGQYNYRADMGAFEKAIKGNKGYLLIYGGNPSFLGVRFKPTMSSKTSYWDNLHKIKASLLDLAKASNKADLSAYEGSWKIKGTNNYIKLSPGIDNDLLMRYGNTVYELNKTEGSVLESYQGTTRGGGDELTLKIISGTEIKLDLGETHLVATRRSGRMATRSNSGSQKNNSSSSISNTASTGSGSLNAKLFTAINTNNENQINEILDLGANVNAKDMQGRTPLEVAIQKSNSDTSIIETLLNKKAQISHSAIEKAVSKDKNTIINFLLENGADKNHVAISAIKKDKGSLFRELISNHNVTINRTMFDTAINSKKHAIADMMISNGFDPNYALDAGIRVKSSALVYSALDAGGNGTKALKFAIDTNDSELANNSIDNHNANLNEGLKHAINGNKKSLIELLLNKGASPDTAIESLSSKGNDTILRMLLEKGGNANLGIKAAATANKISTLKLLLEKKADATPILPIAIQKNNTEMVKLALDNKASVNSSKFISTATKNGNIDIVTLLIKAGANAQDGVEAAVDKNKANILKLLINEGADASSGKLLAVATSHKNPQLVDVLLKADANPQDGIKAAINYGSCNILQQLIDAGGKANDQDLLTRAVLKNNYECSRILINEGLDATKSDSNGISYLHHAAQNDNAALTKLLIEKGADVNAMAQGSTPLHLAVRNRKGVATVDMLIKGGADVNAINSKGKKVLRIARGRKIKKLLKQNGAEKK